MELIFLKLKVLNKEYKLFWSVSLVVRAVF